MRRISELYTNQQIIQKEQSFLIPGNGFPASLDDRKKRVVIIALGDVGGTLLMGLRLLGGEHIASIGLVDLNEKVLGRYEMEVNQIVFPDHRPVPSVYVAEDPFDSDIVLFCATAGIPPVGKEQADVRMVQYEANRKIIHIYTQMAKERGYEGAFYVVSDPVDLLCRAVVEDGIPEDRVRGFGLGVMYARAAYYSGDQERFFANGRVFGPHGEDLVVADDVFHYHHEESLQLTEQTVTSNLKTRALGFKPYIAPALSSGALSLAALMEGGWHYSSISFGNAFLGCRNRLTREGREIEDLPLEDELFARIEKSYRNLKGFAV